MKPQISLAALAICIALSARLLADDPSQASANEKTHPSAGRFTFVTSDWTAPIQAGQFLAAIAYTNQLGIEVAAVEPPLRAHLDLQESQGVVVTSAAGQGESAETGLQPHDVVLQIDGQAINSPEKFHELAGSRQGKKAALRVLRKGKPIDLEVTFPNPPVYQFDSRAFAGYDGEWIDNQYRIGVTLAQADDVLRNQLRLADGEGLVITDVVADGPSAKTGLRKYDVLVKLDGKRLTTVEACHAQLQEIKDRKVTATFLRGGKEISLELTPQLSTAARWTAPFVSTVFLNDGAAANQRWVGRVNLNTTGVDSIHVTPLEVHWHADLRDSTFTDPLAGGTTAAATASTASAEQIAQLKRQLAEMQKSLAALEATLQPAKTEQSQQQPVQKPQQPNDKPQP